MFKKFVLITFFIPQKLILFCWIFFVLAPTNWGRMMENESDQISALCWTQNINSNSFANIIRESRLFTLEWCFFFTIDFSHHFFLSIYQTNLLSTFELPTDITHYQKFLLGFFPQNLGEFYLFLSQIQKAFICCFSILFKLFIAHHSAFTFHTQFIV